MWNGSSNGYGYGRISSNGGNKAAHRVSWEIHFGKIPKGGSYPGTCILHKCDNPPCVNPEHLYIGTQKDNVQDMIQKRRENHETKITKEVIVLIRDLHRNRPDLLQKTLAKEFGICEGYISDIINNKKRKDDEYKLVYDFSEAMYKKLAERRKRYKPFGWRKRALVKLYDWLDDEVYELTESDDPKEAVDVALLAFMIWDVINNRK